MAEPTNESRIDGRGRSPHFAKSFRVKNSAHVDKLSKRLTEGYRAIVKKTGLQVTSSAPDEWAR